MTKTVSSTVKNRYRGVPSLRIFIVVGLFTALGMLYGLTSRAATPYISAEPEAVAPTGPAVIGSDTAASGGKFVRFGTGGNPGKANTFWLHFNSTPVSNTMLETEAKRRKVIVLNAWEHQYIPTLKAANPNIVVLVYKDLSSTRDYECTNGVDSALLPTGIGYCFADTYHKDWFLLDSAGKRLAYSGYAGHWQMDVGNVAYQQQWAANVKTELTARGWDGVFMDNALVSCDQYHTGVCPAKYTTDVAIQAAYSAMLKVTYPALKNAGLKSVANMSNARLYPGIWNTYLANLDGGFDEWWLTFDPGNHLAEYGTPSIGWKAQVDEIAAAEAAGKMAIVQAHTRYTDKPSFYYGLASYFLASGGNSSYGEIDVADNYSNPSPWQPAYDWNLGAPVSAYSTISTHLYRRDFKCGAAIVNANNTVATTVSLGGTYLNESGASVTSVAMAAKTGTVLRKPNCSP
ncbi:MAG TPA: putative glycoside hydrolase [Candidatus Saccharimonadales bacterium]|jgi:hypothetical protein